MPVIKSKVVRVKDADGIWHDLPATVSQESFRAAERAAESVEEAKYWADQAEYVVERVADMRQELDDLESDFYYKAVSITSFTSSVTQAEIGSTVNAVTLTYAINKTPSTLKLDGNAMTPAQSGSIALTGQGLTANKTWTLTATDEGSASSDPATSTKTASLTFLNRCCYGAAASGTVNSAFVNALDNKVLTNTKARTITVNAGSGEYIWYAVPTRFGACTFQVGGFDGGFEPAQTVSVTNASGYTENYYVYRSTNASLGSTTVVIS